MGRPTIRLKVKDFLKAAIENDLYSDAALAKQMKVSTTQIWRVKTGDNAPGAAMIAAVLSTFGGKFEDYFYLDGGVSHE